MQPSKLGIRPVSLPLMLLLTAASHMQAQTRQTDSIPPPAFDTLRLAAITVTAPAVTRQADRFVVTIGNSPAFAGLDGTELLQRAPGVRLDDKSISINGASGTKVYIDGRELKGTTEENVAYLRSLTSAEIARVEVVPLASAEFAADASNEEIEKAVLSHQNSAKWLDGKAPKKVIIVPKKIVNVVL